MDLKNGNLVTPKGASLIFGKEANSSFSDILTNNDDTYSPYTIVITEESENETISAAAVEYNNSTTTIASDNVQGAITELHNYIKNQISIINNTINNLGGAHIIVEYNSSTAFSEITTALAKDYSVWLTINTNIVDGTVTNNVISVPLSSYSTAANGSAIYYDFEINREDLVGKIARVNSSGWQILDKVSISNIYTTSIDEEPDASLGQDGDLYLITGES